MLTRLLLAGVACLAANGQTFEAASIKAATVSGPRGMIANQKGGPGTGDPGLFTCENCSLYWVLADAYKIHEYDFSGPAWLQDARFDFSAKIRAGATGEEFQTMLRNLLAERFQMTTHHETRMVPVYEMAVGKNGPKFQESTPHQEPKDDGPPPKFRRDAEGYPILDRAGMGLAPGHGRLRSQDQPISWFAEILSNQLRTPIIDATGLKGKYDFTVQWSWEEGPEAMPGAAAALASAVQSELGLKLERKKGPVNVLVIDHIEKTPAAN